MQVSQAMSIGVKGRANADCAPHSAQELSRWGFGQM